MRKFKKRLAQFILIIFALSFICSILYAVSTVGWVYLYAFLGAIFISCLLAFAITHYDD